MQHATLELTLASVEAPDVPNSVPAGRSTLAVYTAKYLSLSLFLIIFRGFARSGERNGLCRRLEERDRANLRLASAGAESGGAAASARSDSETR